MDLAIALEGFFFEKVNRSTGQRVTFHFTILYIIADDARLTPPHCKKHTASFARSTGKFPSINKEGIHTRLTHLSSYNSLVTQISIIPYLRHTQEITVFSVCKRNNSIYPNMVHSIGCYDWLEFFRNCRHARIYLPKAIKSVSLLVFMIFMNFSSGDSLQFVRFISDKSRLLPCVWCRLCIVLKGGSRLPPAPRCKSYTNAHYLAQPVSGVYLFQLLVCGCWFSALLFRASCSGISPRLGTSPVRNRLSSINIFYMEIYEIFPTA